MYQNFINPNTFSRLIMIISDKKRAFLFGECFFFINHVNYNDIILGIIQIAYCLINVSYFAMVSGSSTNLDENKPLTTRRNLYDINVSFVIITVGSQSENIYFLINIPLISH